MIDARQIHIGGVRPRCRHRSGTSSSTSSDVVAMLAADAAGDPRFHRHLVCESRDLVPSVVLPVVSQGAGFFPKHGVCPARMTTRWNCTTLTRLWRSLCARNRRAISCRNPGSAPARICAWPGLQAVVALAMAPSVRSTMMTPYRTSPAWRERRPDDPGKQAGSLSVKPSPRWHQALMPSFDPDAGNLDDIPSRSRERLPPISLLLTVGGFAPLDMGEENAFGTT